MYMCCMASVQGSTIKQQITLQEFHLINKVYMKEKKGSIDGTKVCSKESKAVHAGDSKDISKGSLIKKGKRRKFAE